MGAVLVAWALLALVRYLRLRQEAPPAVIAPTGSGVSCRTPEIAAAMESRQHELTAPEGPAPAATEQS